MWVYRLILAAFGGLPLLILCGTLLAVWIDPMSVNRGNWLRAAATMIMFEFLMLHSGAFMAAGPTVSDKRTYQLAWFIGFALVYGLAIYGFARWTRGDYLVWALAGIGASRLMTLVIIQDKKGIILMLQRSAMGMIVLLMTALLCFIPWPALGIDESLRYAAFGSKGDFLSSHPQRMIAWGVGYYFAMGLVELYVGWWLPDWSDEEAESAWMALRSKDTESVLQAGVRFRSQEPLDDD